MLNILETQKNFFDYKSLDSHIIPEKNKIQLVDDKKQDIENNKIQNRLDVKEYKNMIYYPSSNKE